ncbi:MAG: recombinase family protein [Actinomycetota bacterium]|nr:recombinase family protein [Actinomycetota bacterium]
MGSSTESAGVDVRVVGYVREASSLTEGETAFAQSEQIRRWTADSGHHLVATCQDGRDPAQPLGRDGFRALIDIARSGNADALVVSELSVLSSDKVTQEIMLNHLRELGLTIVSTSEPDHDELLNVPENHTRLVVRDVIAKVDEFRKEFPETVGEPADPTDADVIVQLMPHGTQREDRAAHAARPTA